MDERVHTRRRAGVLAVPAAAAALAAGLLLWPASQAARAMTLSPLSGTPDASPWTQISFLGVPASEISSVSVTGSRSGRHAGSLQAYASAAGASFVPAKPFVQGESVSVRASVGAPGHRRSVGTWFLVARLAAYRTKPLPSPPGPKQVPAAAAVQSFVSAPTLHPPALQVMVSSPGQAPGDVFLSPAHGPGQFGPMIVDGAGRLVWFQPTPPGTVPANLQVQQLDGKPVLTWWQGQIASLGIGFGEDVVYDSGYRLLARIAAGNGYKTDLHELKLEGGSAYLTANTIVGADLSSAGGPSHGELVDSLLQRVDIKTGLVMYEWHAWGHVPLTESYTAPAGTAEPWDYFHMNSISLDPWGDGNMLISSRNTWAAYEISGHTGGILWRLGGKRPTFSMGPGTGLAWQHDARWQPDHTVTIFDDGAKPKIHSQSRVIRERIDWGRRRVSVVTRWLHTPALLAGSQGSYQALPGGNSFAGWGEEPYLTEFGPSGQMLFDAKLPPLGQSYRAYRFPWSAAPATPPALVLTRSGATTLTAYASWNGATGVRQWRILAGPSAARLAPVAQATSSGFETAIHVSSPAAWFAAQALDGHGHVLAGSAPVQG